MSSNDFDILLTDASRMLKTEISQIFGVDYLSKASAADANFRHQPHEFAKCTRCAKLKKDCDPVPGKFRAELSRVQRLLREANLSGAGVQSAKAAHKPSPVSYSCDMCQRPTEENNVAGVSTGYG
ncbi:hypothetical protein VTN77DRAFT_2224 [Rasamsonia byssochlamydoides]|uniref:uncharacterized protein n=1 Tax=Rasamsonia byssochlamydoides TaxID=89139 RepID=UPI0037446D52